MNHHSSPNGCLRSCPVCYPENLDRYKKNKKEKKSFVESVSLTKEHHDFVSQNEISLTLLLREKLDEIIEKTKGK